MRWISIIVFSLAALVGCAGGNVAATSTAASSLPTTPVTTSATASSNAAVASNATATPIVAPVTPSVTTAASAEPSPSGPSVLVFPVVHDGSVGKVIPAGRYVTPAAGFFPGLGL